MAVLSSNLLTLADWGKRLDPDGRVPIVAELLSQSNEILTDAVFVEGNLPTGHRVTVRTGLPTVYWRSVNSGIPTSKSTTQQVDESTGMLEAFCRVDRDIADLNGNTAQFRLSEDKAFLEAMNQAQAGTMFYGNPATDPRQYLGLAPRYSAIAGAGNGVNVLSGGGAASNNTSIWLVGWGDPGVFCMFPKGSKAGIMHEDNGLLTIYDASGNPFRAYETHYQWKNGLVVKDWRYVVRIANINTANLVAQSAAADIITLMSRALDRFPSWSNIRPAFYMNRTVYSMLRVQALQKSNYALSVKDGLTQFGTPTTWLDFQGVPLRRVDQILNTESTVS